MEDMRAIADVAPLLTGKARARVDRMTALVKTPEPLDRAAAREEYLALAGAAWVGA
jgi:hypothetical protein